MRTQPALILSVTLLAATAVGCGSDPQPPAKTGGDTGVPTANAVPTAAVPPKQVDTATPSSGSVQIEDKILKACGDIPQARFAFDSTSIEGPAATALDALARCFVSGPLKGKNMRLVGHADPRGETEYNLALGHKRAGSVGEYLGKKGMEASRIATTSKGEFEATGVDDEGWARDRKVEVFLAE
ncbi:OmpA family protein [Chondromyces apiculatus]|uniref:Peptidoglycan-associated lipoprotein/OmpA/MotB n=1 Tax=Chondromyces apiculatus DSM 436 TaxID=1192034 RepID=A0A017T7G0_9BACT|nr:OmpA family protein [Chondromyces apiculatus]EYF04511.1 Peptidoglycan-associated lipoprotein precursor/OmpA/MotB precursor [Chondromyces apiculatus DSM 436]